MEVTTGGSKDELTRPGQSAVCSDGKCDTGMEGQPWGSNGARTEGTLMHSSHTVLAGFLHLPPFDLAPLFSALFGQSQPHRGTPIPKPIAPELQRLQPAMGGGFGGWESRG